MFEMFAAIFPEPVTPCRYWTSLTSMHYNINYSHCFCRLLNALSHLCKNVYNDALKGSIKAGQGCVPQKYRGPSRSQIPLAACDLLRLTTLLGNAAEVAESKRDTCTHRDSIAIGLECSVRFTQVMQV